MQIYILHCYCSRNVSKYNFCFSDFPFRDDARDFPHHTDLDNYINSYTNINNIRRYIRFHSKVTSLRRANDLWKVTTESTGTSQITVLTARFVAVATGHHAIPHMAHFDGLESFPGRIIHSSKYKSSELNGVHGGRLLIVGIGNSAIDAATEAALSGHCEVLVSTRSGAWVLSNYVCGYPIDLHVCRLFLWMPWKISTIITEAIIRMTSGHPKKWGLNPKTPQLAGHPAIGPALIHCIQRGFVQVKPDIAR
jgi:dimethylaniline monooxygenase (N-oxide forming)